MGVARHEYAPAREREAADVRDAAIAEVLALDGEAHALGENRHREPRADQRAARHVLLLLVVLVEVVVAQVIEIGADAQARAPILDSRGRLPLGAPRQPRAGVRGRAPASARLRARRARPRPQPPPPARAPLPVRLDLATARDADAGPELGRADLAHDVGALQPAQRRERAQAILDAIPAPRSLQHHAIAERPELDPERSSARRALARRRI